MPSVISGNNVAVLALSDLDAALRGGAGGGHADLRVLAELADNVHDLENAILGIFAQINIAGLGVSPAYMVAGDLCAAAD